jgi:hypothetical protein
MYLVINYVTLLLLVNHSTSLLPKFKSVVTLQRPMELGANKKEGANEKRKPKILNRVGINKLKQ